MRLENAVRLFGFLGSLRSALCCFEAVEPPPPPVPAARDISGKPDPRSQLSQLNRGESRWVRFIETKTGRNLFYAWEGGGRTVVSDPAALDCSFPLRNRCCWHNSANRTDELDWAHASRPLDFDSLRSTFAADLPPDPPFLVAGAPKSVASYQAILLSCPIACQSNIGELRLNHWLSDGVTVDVCRLPVGERAYLPDCSTLRGSGASSVPIPPYNKPFYIALVTTGWGSDEGPYGGGAAIIDDIEYYRALFCLPA